MPLLEKIVRAIVVYLFLIFALKSWGKRVMAQLNPFDLVVLLILSNTVQNAIIGNDNSISGGVIGALALLLFNNFVVRRLYGHARLEKWLEGKPDLLIEHGKLREDILKRDGVSKHEVVTAAHKQGFDSLNDIEKAVLAPGGRPLVLPPHADDRRVATDGAAGAASTGSSSLYLRERRRPQDERRDVGHDLGVGEPGRRRERLPLGVARRTGPSSSRGRPCSRTPACR